MINRIILILFGMIGILKLSSQNYIPYFNLRNEALMHFQQKEYKIADSLLNESRSLAPPFGKDVHLAAIIKAELNDTMKCLDLIYQSFGVKDFSITSILVRDSEHLLKVIQKDSFRFLIEKLKIVDEVNFNAKDFENKPEKRIEEIISEFKTAQLNFNNDKENYFINFFETKIFKDIQNEVISFIKEYGWSNSLEIHYNIFYLIRPEKYREFSGLLLTEVMRGNLDPFWYAKWVDDIEYSIYKRTKYATSGGSMAKIEEYKQNRRQIGLSIYYNGPYRNHIKNHCDPNFFESFLK